MTQPGRQVDRNWDELLRRVGPHLQLSEGSAFGRWKPGEANAPVAGALRLRRRRRRLTLWTGSGALAASVALWLFFLLPARQLDADTIFNSLRRAVHHTMRLTLENVEVDLSRWYSGLHGQLRCSGTVVAADEGRRQAFAELDVSLRGEAGAQRVPPTEFTLTTVAVPGAEWAYVRLRNAPRASTALDPRLALLTELARHGFYIDLADIVDSKLGHRALALPVVGLGAAFRLRDREGMVALIDLIQQHMHNPAIKQLGPQRYELLARGLRAEAAGAGTATGLRSALAGLLRDAHLRVLYDTQEGVQLVELEHFGHGDGRVLLEWAGAELEASRLDLARHQQDHPGPTLNRQVLRACRKIGAFLVRRSRAAA